MASDIAFDPRDHLGYRISLITRRWRAMIDAELEAVGLSEATWRPLLVLALRKSAPRQRDLAEALQIGCPALVRLLDNLEAKKLIERLDVDDDRRAKQVLLTPEGRKLARRVHEIILGIERRLLDGISPADLAVADRIFGSIEQHLDEHDSPDTCVSHEP